MGEISQYLQNNQRELEQKREEDENYQINEVKNYLQQPNDQSFQEDPGQFEEQV